MDVGMVIINLSSASLHTVYFNHGPISYRYRDKQRSISVEKCNVFMLMRL